MSLISLLNRIHVGNCFKFMKLLRTNQSVVENVCCCTSTLSTFDSADFVRNEASLLSKIENELALPFIHLQSILENVSLPKSDSNKPTESPLYDFFVQGHIHRPSINIKYLIEHTNDVMQNIRRRKTDHVNVHEVIALYHRLQKVNTEITKYKKIIKQDSDGDDKTKHSRAKNVVMILTSLQKELDKLYLMKALEIPNKTCPSVPIEGDGPQCIVETVGKKPQFDYPVYDHLFIGKRMKTLRQSNMSRMAGHRNSYLVGGLAELEQALVQYTIDKLKQRNFLLISVPNILKDAVFEGAGIVSQKMDTMIYGIKNYSEPNFCLAGTSEIGICAYFSSHAIDLKNLPLRFCAVSTCYRRESGKKLDRTGIFRVHQFLKVEMFGVTANETGIESANLHEEFVAMQKEMFEELGLHFNVVNMPANDLGQPAYKKIDIEAWFPGRSQYDEISSASNCTDFQSRRLHIVYKNQGTGNYKFAHTVNATACAVPRMIISILENGQKENHEVALPTCLWPYMNGKQSLKKEKLRMLEYIGVEQSQHVQGKFFKNLLDD